jgi:hypothetical protein
MPDLEPAVEQKLADMDDADFSALIARVRPPSSAAQLRDIAGKVITGDQLEAFVSVANLKAFATENGDIDEGKVMGALTGMFGITPESSPHHQDFGQHRPPPPMPGPGDRGKAEAQKRFGPTGGYVAAGVEGTHQVQQGPSIPPSDHRPKSGVRAQLEKRFGRTEHSDD